MAALIPADYGGSGLSMAVTEPSTGSDTTRLKTLAVKKDGRWVVNGQKVWTSRVQHSDMMILLARTTPLTEVQNRSENLLGPEGQGFKVLLDGLNAERTLIVAECIGDGHWFIERATRYAKERVVFNRPIGQNQGVQFPIAETYVELQAADLMRWKPCEKIDAHPCARAAEILLRMPQAGGGP